MSDRYAKISEKMWLIIFIASLLFACYEVFSYGVEEWTYFIMPGLAGVMYIFRRFLRKRFEKNAQ